MGINLGMNQGYSNLFQSLSSSMGSSNFFSEYASIKNGSYSKLMKAYYGGVKNSGTSATSSKSNSNYVLDKILEEKKNPKVSKDVQEANDNLTAAIPNLKSSVSALQSDKTYTDTENGQSAEKKVVSAMKAFVSDYNNVVSSAKRSTLTRQTSYVANMMKSTSANADKLSEIGVSINANGTLQLNESKLKAADISKVQDLFSTDDIMSYGSKIMSRIQFAGTTSSTNTVNRTDTNTTDSTETNTSSVSAAASLKADGKALASEALYEMVKDKDGNETYDIDKIFATAKSFVINYNSMFDAAKFSSNSGVIANLSRIREKTAQNSDALKQFGISVDEKGKMKIDEDTFKKSDMSKVQKFFKDYGSSIATSASLTDFYMTTQANSANGYTSAGAYNVQGSARYADTV